ncbi:MULTISPECIES: hypothetical protein [Bartonella]|uniref:hypothetical protein n=1 Tax=Bartonella TaxID=773 RepID=UPI00235E41AB|nr:MULTISPECIES: hypothetical protein [Bartonella]
MSGQKMVEEMMRNSRLMVIALYHILLLKMFWGSLWFCPKTLLSRVEGGLLGQKKLELLTVIV